MGDAPRREARGDTPVIVSGTGLRTIVHAEVQAVDYLLEPVAREHLVSVVASCCKPREN